MEYSSLWLVQFLCFLLVHFHFQAFCYPSLSLNSSKLLCQYEQSHALLQFKSSFLIKTSAFNSVRKYYDVFTKENNLADDLKYATPYPKTESWKEGTDCCLWDGVTCDLESGNVIGLDLSSSMLYGTLHSNNSLFFLSHLQKLDLSNNNFIGSSIPSQIGQLLNLTHLNLNSSYFVGQVPSQISHLSNLVSLDLSFTRTALKIDATAFSKIFQNLTNLRELFLNGVDISMVDPSSFMNLSPSLLSLGLQNCMLRGKYVNLPNGLVSLDLSDNNLRLDTTDFVKIVQNLTKLKEFDLGSVNLSLVAPSSLTNLTSSLTYLRLQGCGLRGEFPGNLLQRPSLRKLFLADNDFTRFSVVSNSCSNLSQLTHLDLSYNNFTASIPSSLFSLPQLSSLLLNNNRFQGHIGQFQSKSLSYIDLSNNNLQGSIPSSIFSLVNLRVLILSSNYKLTGELSSSYCKLKFLQILDLSNNSFVGFVPQCLGNCKNLEILDLGNNGINDTFPFFLSSLPKLQILTLHSNKLHGSLQCPIAINNCSFSKLRILDISNNTLSGPLPTEFFNELQAMMMTNFNPYLIYISYDHDFRDYYYYSVFATIDLSLNKFIGKIPDSIGKFQSLTVLNISHNHLVGNIQPLLGNLSHLEALDLSSNSLTGRIPMELVNLTSLEVFNVAHNQLEGPIPSGYQFNTFDNGSYEENLGLCGFPLSKECEDDEDNQSNQKQEEDDDSDWVNGFGWRAVMIGYGCGHILGFSMAYIVFTTWKPIWFVKIIEGAWTERAKGLRRCLLGRGGRRY